MRSMILAVAVLTAACVDVNDKKGGGDSSAAAEGYTIEIRANAGQAAYLITAPDGHVAGARTADGASQLLEADAIQSLAGAPEPAADDREETVSMRVPGFELSVRGDPDSEGKGGDEGGRVSMRVGGDRLTIDADEGGPGEADDRAHVRMTGLSEAEVRDFIVQQDELSPSVQAQLLSELGLE